MAISFLRQTLAGLWILLALTIVTGVLYPAVVLLIGQTAFAGKANGTLVSVDGEVVGSALIGQSFDGDEYFLPRPSAAGDGYDALASSASNLGPENPELLASVEERRAGLALANGTEPADVPVDALTASGSGLDPHISPEYARQQVERVAQARGMDEADVRRLVEEQVQRRELGFLGEERVNVLLLNVAVERLRG